MSTWIVVNVDIFSVQRYPIISGVPIEYISFVENGPIAIEVPID